MIEEQKKSNRGGKRPGAGRKKLGAKVKTISVCIGPALLALIDESRREVSRGKFIAQLVAVETAVVSYANNLVSIGRAAELSRLPRGEFEALLADRGIDRNYSI